MTKKMEFQTNATQQYFVRSGEFGDPLIQAGRQILFADMTPPLSCQHVAATQALSQAGGERLTEGQQGLQDPAPSGTHDSLQ